MSWISVTPVSPMSLTSLLNLPCPKLWLLKYDTATFLVEFWLIEKLKFVGNFVVLWMKMLGWRFRKLRRKALFERSSESTRGFKKTVEASSPWALNMYSLLKSVKWLV